jgi:uncharacterized protein (TIGR02996 family)
MERVFLRALAENPHDHVTRAVYADWLEEHAPELATPKARFLRTTAAWAELPAADENRKILEQGLQTLAVELPNQWLAVVSCLPIENCRAGEKTVDDLRRESPFYFVCDRRWEDLRATDSDQVRFCEACSEQVHFCSTQAKARKHARQGHCVALSPELLRQPGDLAPPEPGILGGMWGSAFEDATEPHDEEAHPTPPRREPLPNRSVTEARRRQGKSRGE